MTAHPSNASPDSHPVHHLRSTCRACGDARLVRFLSLGNQPLANAFLSPTADIALEARYPLDVYFCESCALVQLADVIDPRVLFSHYIYLTGTSQTMATHNVGYADALVVKGGLGAGDLALEIASNDGSLLMALRRRAPDVRVLGVEPATNIAAMARQSGIETVNVFFNATTAREIRQTYGAARVVVANNVLAHVDDTRDFLAGIAHVLADDGRAAIEVPYARDMLAGVEYDTVYHEHLCYFSLTPLARLAESVGLRIVRVDHVSVHGGSIRIWLARASQHGDDVLAAIAEESTSLASLSVWRDFAERVERNRASVLDFLRMQQKAGLAVVGYGAPAKANTLLNYCGVSTELLPYTVDRNALKVGSLTPGTHLPVRSVDDLRANRPDSILILAWNFADEIVGQLSDLRDAGTAFYTPLPTVQRIA